MEIRYIQFSLTCHVNDPYISKGSFQALEMVFTADRVPIIDRDADQWRGFGKKRLPFTLITQSC